MKELASESTQLITILDRMGRSKATNHPVAATNAWREHMLKLDFLRRFADSTYEFLVWLDSDNYFVRDPGDLKPLVRDNQSWVSSEGEITSGKARHGDWWEMPMNQVADIMRSYDCSGERLWNTNGGMWIVRREAITEFANKCETVWNELVPKYKTMSDEPPLAIACQSMITDPELNIIEHAGDTWAIDWGQHRAIYRGGLPDGQPWDYEDYLTGVHHTVNPAIVHAMCSKDAMRAANLPRPEPVGTKLSEVIAECNVKKSNCPICQSWIDQMDAWGLDGCRQHRVEILARLAEASDEGNWLDWVKIASGGYLTCGMLLNEAMKRAAAA